MHRAESIQAFAVTLSSTSLVILPLQNSENVSHEISAAKNSATLICTVSLPRPIFGAIVAYVFHGSCQNSPAKPLCLLCSCPKCKTPAIPNDPEASLDNQCSFIGKRLKTKSNDALGIFVIIRRHYFKSNTNRVTSSRCFRG